MDTGKATAVALPSLSERVWLVCLLGVLAAAWFSALELRGLFIPDEARYAEIPREMLQRADWVTPRLNDLKYFEKPPFQYWLTGLSYALFGEDEWTARLPAALLGFLALLMLAHTGRVLWTPRAGALAALICGSAWGFYLSGQYLTLDMTLAACLTMVLCSILLAQAGRGRAWHFAAWGAAALAVLSKGLVGIVLPVLTVLAYAALTGQGKVVTRLVSPWGALVFLGIAAPWFVLVQQRNPEFFEFFFVHEHVERFLYPDHHRPGPWWYYAPVLLAGFMPWSFMLLREMLAVLRTGLKTPAGFSPALFAVLWAAMVVGFFSASRSKLPAYVVPAFPALALFLAGRLDRDDPAAFRLAGWSGLLAGTLGLIVLAEFRRRGFLAVDEEGLDATLWLYAAALVLVSGSAAAICQARPGRELAATSWILLATFGAWSCVFGFLHAVDGNYSAERLIEGLTRDSRPFNPQHPFFSVDLFDHSVPFYLGRPVTLVAAKGELAPGVAAEPDKFVDSIERFEDVWRAQQQAYAIMKADRYAALRDRLPMVRQADDRRYIVVSRR